MATKAATRSELIDRIEELEEENAALSDKLSSITESSKTKTTATTERRRPCSGAMGINPSLAISNQGHRIWKPIYVAMSIN